ncbi:MAG TPA: winged helix-turn-helix domain-containing protein [Anaerolineae bacterium]|nr:winged helix-turn-helix domain-containing protein [Anaerolineae bacterium]
MPLPTQSFLVPTTSHDQFHIAPAQNIFYSLLLLTRTETLSGLNEWITTTAATLTAADEMYTHRLVMLGFYHLVRPQTLWPDFPAYLAHLAQLPPADLPNTLLNAYRSIPNKTDTPPPNLTNEEILASADTFITFLQHRFSAEHIDEPLERHAYQLLQQPHKLKDTIINHLNYMWTTYMQPEWTRITPLLNASIQAFQSIDLSTMPRHERVQFVTGQTLANNAWQEKLLAQTDAFLFVPSAHVGPYLGHFKHDNQFGIIFGARLPAGSLHHNPDLDRNELLVRLNALADDTRLRILRFLTENGEHNSQQIMTALDLSQSAASRHLKQLSATGYLRERRCHGAKCYQIDTDRVDSTLRSLENFLLN